MIQQTNGGGAQASADRIQPIEGKAQLAKHQKGIGQRASTVSQDRASRLQQQPQSQNAAPQHAGERRATKVQPPNNLNLIHPSATCSKDSFSIQQDAFTSNSILSQLKSGNYGSIGRDKQMDPIADRCLTTTASSAPKNLINELALTLNSAKNQVSSMGSQAMPWDSIVKQTKPASAVKQSSDQPASVKRRESSTKTGTMTYNSQGQTSTKADSQLQFFPQQKGSNPPQPAVRNSVQTAQAAAAIFLQPQQLKLMNLADQQQYAMDQLANFPSSSKSQKSVKSTKSSKGKATFGTTTLQKGVAAQLPIQTQNSQISQSRQINKQSPSIERDQARLEKLQSAPKTVAKKKAAQTSNSMKGATQQVQGQQTMSQKKQQRVKFNVVNQNNGPTTPGGSQPQQQIQPQLLSSSDQPEMIIDEHQSKTMEKASPTAAMKPQHLNLNTVGANSSQALASKPVHSVKNQMCSSTINTPKQNLKFKSQTKQSQPAPHVNSLSGILFDQQSQSKPSTSKSVTHSLQVNDSGSTEAPSNRQYHSQAYQDTSKVTTSKKTQQSRGGQGSDTKASRQSIQGTSAAQSQAMTSHSQQNSHLGVSQQTATSSTIKAPKTKSTSIKRSTGQTATQSRPQQQSHQVAAKSQTAMMVKASQQVPKTTKRVPSNLASHEKIRVAKQNQGSSERSPNGISSQDGRSTKAANKSFQFGHQTQLMSCSSGGESSTNQVTKNRSLSGKQTGGPQIKIRQNLGVLPQDLIMTNLQFQPGTATACLNQNNQEQIKTFSFIKDDKRKKVELQKGEQQNKHNSLICLKNVRSGNSTSQDSKTRKPMNQATAPPLLSANTNTQIPQLISQSPTPANLKFKNQVKSVQQTDLTEKKEKLQLEESRRQMKLQLKETSSNQSYQIPVHTGMHSVKSTGHVSKSIKVQKHHQQQQSQEPEPVQEQSEGDNTPDQQDPLLPASGDPSPHAAPLPSAFPEEADLLETEQVPSAEDKRQIMNDLANIQDKQTEIIKLLSNSEEKEMRERSKERIQETLKSLEQRLDNFSQISNQHTQFIKQIAYLQRQSHSRQSNFSVSDHRPSATGSQLEEKKVSGTPQPRNWVDGQTMDYIANLSNFEKSARLLLVINEEPRLSLISEGLNSLVTVDEYLMTTHQVSANVQGSSEGPQTLRQVSKCSQECPGGTSDDLSIVSLSEILPDDHHLEMYVGFQSSSQQRKSQDDPSDDDEVLTLADVVMEEQTDFNGQQSAPQIPIIKHTGLTSDNESPALAGQAQDGKSVDTDVERLSKSQKLKKEDIITKMIKSKTQSKDDQDKSRVIQLVASEKPTNLSANSAEMNGENQQIFHSLERIRQESGGSQMVGKKISFFKNAIKIKQNNDKTLNSSDRQDTSIQVISKKTLAMIKQNMGATPNVYVSNDVIIGPDDSCEISGIVNASDTQSSTAARGFSSLVASLPHRIDNYMQGNNNKDSSQQQSAVQQPGGKSSGNISPFHPKFRIQQRSLERDQLFFGKSSTLKADSAVGQQEASAVDTSSGHVNQQSALLGQLGCATPKSIPSGKTIMISKQKFQTVLGQNKSPEGVQPQKPIQNPTSFSASQLTEIIATQQQPKKEKKLQIMVKHPMGGSGETFDLLQNKMRMVKSLNRGQSHQVE